MSRTHSDFTKLGFAKTFVLPALLVFLIPILSLAFFRHAEAQFDANVRKNILQDISADTNLSDAERKAAIAHFTETLFSQIITDDQVAATIDPSLRFDYATFRWMIRLSIWSLVSGVVVFLLAGACAIWSQRSQLAQYWSLLIGWHVLRIYGALQTVVVGILLLALSFWVTALWFNMYSVKLIFIAGALAVVAAGVVLKAIFTKPKHEFVVEGTVLGRDAAPSLWEKLNAICAKVGANAPEQVIAGIDDNFFVTELPVTVDRKQYQGSTLFVSLSLLKQLNASEADTVLAHEMAHFSGQDTLYSKRIAPLLRRYEMYLQSLYNGVITKPIYYFMLCFRALFELSLGKISREREFRADKIATSITSPRDFAGSMYRIAAYSKFRGKVEEELFKQQQVLETADVSQRIERGFPAYAVSFASEPNIGGIETAHPFDSHPPLAQRVSAVGVQLNEDEIRSFLSVPGDGGWRQHIPNADEMEQKQWQAFEERFRIFHEETLPYRLLPATAEEQAIVEAAFPPREFQGKNEMLSLDFEKIRLSSWSDSLYYSEITQCQLTDKGVLQIHYEREGKQKTSIKMKSYRENQEPVITSFRRYYGRYLAAADYQRQIGAGADPQAESRA